MVKFSIATPNDIDSLIKLWSLCFSDDPEYLNRLSKHIFERSKTYIATDENRVISSLSVFYTSYFSVSGNTIPGGYLYGVCTHPQYRGQHLSSSLLHYAKTDLVADGLEFLITRPAEESLFGLYEKIGFNSALYLSKTIVEIGESFGSIKSESSQVLLASDFYSMRENYLKKNLVPHIIWSAEMLEYITSDIISNNGFALKIGEKYCIGYPEEEKDHIITLEHTFNEQISDLFPYLKSIYPQIKSLTSFRPSNTSDISKEKMYLAISLTQNHIAKRLAKESCYFNFPME